MALMLSALYHALLEGHISEDTARKAAEEVAAYDNRLAAVESRLTLLTWMVGTNVALTVAVLGKLLIVK